jgi:hypothetical protein
MNEPPALSESAPKGIDVLVLCLDRPISAKRRLKKKGFSEGKEFAGLRFPGLPEQIGR